MLLGFAGDHRQGTKHGRMQAVVNTGNTRVVTIDSQNILRQIVGANRDKIDAVCQLRQHKDH